MTTLNDALLAVARYTLPKHAGLSTAAGTTTTLVDATRLQANDQFNNGVLFFRSGTYANQYKVITDYASASGTFTYTTATAGAPGSGILYEAFALHSGMNLYDIIAAINQALANVGDVLQEDETLDTVDGQESYDLPTGVYNVRRVEIGRNTTAPYEWMNLSHWQEINLDLRIPNQYAYFGDGYPIRVTYLAAHATLDSYEDVVNAQVNPHWLTYAAAINLIRGLAVRGQNWEDYKVLYEEAQQRAATIRPLRGILPVVHGA